MPEIFLLVLALLLIGTPEASIVCLLIAVGTSIWRQKNARKELDEWKTRVTAEHESLRREMGELRRELRANAAAAPSESSVPTTVKVATPAEAMKRAESIAPPVQPQVAVPPKLPEPRIVSAPVVAATTTSTEPAMAPEVKAPPLTQPLVSPAARSERPEAARTTTPPPPTATSSHPEPPIVFQTPLIHTPPIAVYERPSKPRKSLSERLKSALALEEVLGTNWLNKLGVIILVLGLAFFGVYEMGQMGPLGRVIVLAGVAASLLAAGILLERRKTFEIIGKTLIGGGWALGFFTSYAMYHVAAMKVLSSQTVDLIAMLIVACGMVVHTLKYRSQWVTGVAFLLGFSTIALTHDTVYALAAGAILTAGLVAIVQKMGWYELEVFGILASYLNHIGWLYKILGPAGAQGRLFAEFVPSISLLAFYWLVFRASYIWRKIRNRNDENVSTVAALLNTLLLLGAAKFQSARPQLAFYALLALGALEFLFGQLSITRKRRPAFIVLSLLGAVLMFIAVPFKFAGNSTAILWMAGAEVFLLAGVLLKEIVFRRIALIVGVAAGIYWAVFDTATVLRVRIDGDERRLLHEGIVLATCAALYWINAYAVRSRWNDLFKNLDASLVSAQAYLGGIAAFVACIALSATQWTAVCWPVLALVAAAIARKLTDVSLVAQGVLFSGAAVAWLYARNLRPEVIYPSHIGARIVAFTAATGMLYLSAFVLRNVRRNEARLWRILSSAGATLALTLLIRVETSWYWHPALWMAIALVLAEVAREVRSLNLQIQTHSVAALALFTSMGWQFDSVPLWHGVRTPLVVVAPLIACVYWLAWRITWKERREAFTVQTVYTWLATIVAAALFFRVLPHQWAGMAWITYGCALMLVARWRNFKSLEYHGPALSLLALPLLFTETLPIDSHLGMISERLIIVALSAAVLYAGSRRSMVAANTYAPLLAKSYTWAATSLLATLAAFEVQQPWLAVVWAVFALVLIAIDRFKSVDELPWQAQALALLAAGRVASFDLQTATPWHGISTRLLSISAVAVALYCVARWVRMPEQWRTRSLHHVYSWTASTFACWMMWYELKPVSVAVGWALFGLLLFESGFVRKEMQLRVQAYVAFASAFARIFFVNLTASSTTRELLSPAVYTVVPLALVFYFVYSQLQDRKAAPELERWPADQLVAYFGSVAVASVLYFQIRGDWTLTAWAMMLVALTASALIFNRFVFMEQATLLTVAIVWRGVTHNLFGSSYFDSKGWTGSFVVTGSAIVLMLATLPLAFRLRERFEHSRDGMQRFKAVRLLSGHPDQLLFFAPMLLLTLMLALKMRAGMVTVAWGIEGVLVFLFALTLQRRSYRLTGLVLLLLCVGKIMAFDAWRLQPRDRYLTFIVLGAVLLAVSFLYSRYREMVRQYL